MVYTDMKGILTRKSCSFVYAKMLVKQEVSHQKRMCLCSQGKICMATARLRKCLLPDTRPEKAKPSTASQL